MSRGGRTRGGAGRKKNQCLLNRERNSACLSGEEVYFQACYSDYPEERQSQGAGCRARVAAAQSAPRGTVLRALQLDAAELSV